MVRVLGRPLGDYPELELSGEHGLESLSKYVGDTYLDDAAPDGINQASHLSLLSHGLESPGDEGGLDLAAALVGAWSANDIESLENVADFLLQIRLERKKLEEAILLLREIICRLEHAIQALASSLEEA